MRINDGQYLIYHLEGLILQFAHIKTYKLTKKSYLQRTNLQQMKPNLQSHQIDKLPANRRFRDIPLQQPQANTQNLATNLSSQHLAPGTQLVLNEETCFKCKLYGELFCCENCFRSYHWKCIGERKIDELNKMTHVASFICEACDPVRFCVKCQGHYPNSGKMALGDYSEQISVLAFYKCTHCNSMVHKKCLDVPLEVLNSSATKQSQLIPFYQKQQPLTHYICQTCVQSVGFTQIIKTQRLPSPTGIQKLYYLILLKTPSPIHQGWFEQSTLRKYIKSFQSSKTFIEDFVNCSDLYLDPKIDKIVAMMYPMKYKGVGVGEVARIVEARAKIPVGERYGSHDGFKFLVKWKGRDYTGMSWEDEVVVSRDGQALARFLKGEERWKVLWQAIVKRYTPKDSTPQNFRYKVVECLLAKEPQILKKYLMSAPAVLHSSQSKAYKTFEQKMDELGDEMGKDSFIQVIYANLDPLTPMKNQLYYRQKLIHYLRHIYLYHLTLRPTLIISHYPARFQSQISSLSQVGNHKLRTIRLSGNKANTTLIKKTDFFQCTNPCLYKFDVLIVDYTYFMYENEYIFNNIPQFFAVVFDGVGKVEEGLKYLDKYYFGVKSKVQREIVVVDEAWGKENVRDFVQGCLEVANSKKNTVKRAVYHNVGFQQVEKFSFEDSRLKIMLEKKYKDSLKVFDLGQHQLLNQAQRLSFLQLIMSYGLNIKKVQDICQKLLKTYPSTWSNPFDYSNQTMIQKVRKYLSLFMSVVAKNAKKASIKQDKIVSESQQHSSLQSSSCTAYFLFQYQPVSVLKRIIKVKLLKSQIQKHFDDHSQFPIKLPFKFFFSGQTKSFPMWNTYEDYTLGALMVEEGYGRWKDVLESKKWVRFHAELETRKVYEFDAKESTFKVQEKIVPVKRRKGVFKVEDNGEKFLIEQLSSSGSGRERSEMSGSSNRLQQEQVQPLPATYGEYLVKKIHNSKQFKQVQYEHLSDLAILQSHIAERGQRILMAMNFPKAK